MQDLSNKISVFWFPPYYGNTAPSLELAQTWIVVRWLEIKIWKLNVLLVSDIHRLTDIYVLEKNLYLMHWLNPLLDNVHNYYFHLYLYSYSLIRRLYHQIDNDYKEVLSCLSFLSTFWCLITYFYVGLGTIKMLISYPPFKIATTWHSIGIRYNHLCHWCYYYLFI